MAGLFEMLSKTATDAVTKAGTKAEELMEVNKYRNLQNERKGDLAKAKRKIGEYVFKQYEDGAEMDEALTKLCQEVQKLRDEIKELDDKITEVHENAKAKQPDFDGERL